MKERSYDQLSGRASETYSNPNRKSFQENIKDELKKLENRLSGRNCGVTTAELANFYLALAVSPFTVLIDRNIIDANMLTKLFAQAIGAKFYSIQVQPHWDNTTHLFGYMPKSSSNLFFEGIFTRILTNAMGEPNRLFLVLLDGINRAPVEHYFSDFLSVIETRRRENGVFTTDPLPMELPPPQSPDPYSNLRDLRLPANIRVVGTANMDETTRTFSRRVLDRVFSVEFDEPDLTAFASETESKYDSTGFPSLMTRLLDPANPVSVDEAYSSSETLFEGIGSLLEDVRAILRPAGISLGYHTRNDICLYMHFWKEFQLSRVLSATGAMDFCFMQKILPKINGTGEALGDALKELLEWLNVSETNSAMDSLSIDPCESRPWKRSADKVGRMIKRLEVESATTYWGT